MKKHIYLLFFLVYCLQSNTLLQAQVPTNSLGLNPYSLDWNQINTDKVQVIFPRGLEKQGQRVANIIHAISDSAYTSVGNKNEKVSIFLQNQTTIPNGFVTVGPFRSEFFVTPPQFNLNGTANWIDMLAIHEYRHVQQFSNSMYGITKLARRVLGSWTWGGMTGTALPRWYFEGDAVGTETALSEAGRGRLPEFDMEYKALIMNDINYGYEKASAGSFKDFVPDHYSMGYYMTTYARRQFGEDIWQKTLKDAVKYKGLFFPLSRSLKRSTDLRTPEMYRAMRFELDSMWKAQDAQMTYIEGAKFNQKKKTTVTDYRNPQYLEDGSIIAEKSSYSEIRTFYRIYPDGREERIANPGINSLRNTTLSIANNLLCWAEIGFGARWGYQNYSNIKTYQLNTERRTKVTSQGRYFAPSLHPDGSRIVTVEISTDLQYQLVIMGNQEEYIFQKIPNTENKFLSFPRFTEDGKSIVYVAQQGEANWIEMIDLEKADTPIQLTSPNTYQITNVFAKGEYVYFSGAHTGINNIFAVKTSESNILYQITSVKLGAFQPAISPDGKKLIYSDFTPQGYDLREINLTPETWKVYQEDKPSPTAINYYKPLVAQELGGSILSKATDQEFEVKKYNKWQGIFNPHSILPFFSPPVFGARILADNKFSTLSTELSAFYNSNENTTNYGVNISYAELYPIINAGFRSGMRERTFTNFAPTSDTSIVFSLYNEKWRENDAYIGLALPINFTQGTMSNRLNISANYHFLSLEGRNQFSDPNNFQLDIFPINSNRFQSIYKDRLQSQSLQALDLRMRLSLLQITALQNLAPRFGIIWDMRYRSTLNSDELQGSVFLNRFDVFLPGLMRNHAFYVNTMFQVENFTNNYKFSNQFFYARGYRTSTISDQVFRIGFNYALPLFSPDIAFLGPLAFLKRVKANLFFDIDYSQYNIDLLRPVSQSRRSLGTEITFDIRALRLLEVNLGVRYSYLLDTNGGSAHTFDFLLLNIGI
jgi:hypothetical protein